MSARDDLSRALEKIAETHGGRLTPEAVVDAARDPDSILHAHFEWDDGKAGAAHRLNQARTIIRSVRVVIRTETTRIESVAYVRDPQAGASEQGYRSVVSLRSDKDVARDALINEVTRARSMMIRCRELAAALDVAGDLEEQIDSLQRFSERVEDRTFAMAA